MKRSLKLLTVAVLLSAPMVQALNKTKVYIKNNTDHEWTILGRMRNKQSVFGWTPLKEKTKLYDDKITIKPDKKPEAFADAEADRRRVEQSVHVNADACILDLVELFGANEGAKIVSVQELFEPYPDDTDLAGLAAREAGPYEPQAM